jgi:Pectate lyase./Ricin-type beta-trefoil lectin domain.
MSRLFYVGLGILTVLLSLSITTHAQSLNGRYQIISVYSGKAIDVDGFSQENGANIMLWDDLDGTNQQWDITDLGNGYHSIIAVHSGKAMDDYGWCVDPGCEVRQWDYWGGDGQQWGIYNSGSGYKIINKFNGLALDVWEWNANAGADVRMWTDLGGVNQQWTLTAAGSSGGGSGGGSTGGYGSTCNGGSTTTVTATIRVEDGGTFDGGCNTYNGGGALGDGSQDEGQDPIFRVGPGLVRNVYIGSNGADGIHTRNGGDVDNIHWSDVGEDAMTIKDPTNGATVTSYNIEGYDSADKFLQANDDGTWIVNNCLVSNAGKFLRQNGGSTFPLHMDVTNCDISNMGEGIFRSDSSNSTARITNSRLSNAGDICIGSWSSCTSSGITNY